MQRMNKEEFKKKLRYGDRYCVKHNTIDGCKQCSDEAFKRAIDKLNKEMISIKLKHCNQLSLIATAMKTDK